MMRRRRMRRKRMRRRGGEERGRGRGEEGRRRGGEEGRRAWTDVKRRLPRHQLTLSFSLPFYWIFLWLLFDITTFSRLQDKSRWRQRLLATL